MKEKRLTESALRHGLQLTVDGRQVISQYLQLGVRVLLGHAGHDGVTSTHFRIVFNLVGLQCDQQIVSMLATQLGVGRVNRLAEVAAVA